MINKPVEPVHVPGTHKGEQVVLDRGREPGRVKGRGQYRTARDSTSINPEHSGPIDAAMPNIPPA